MKVIIAGSRGIRDIKDVREAIKQAGFEISKVVSGTATGPDKLGEQWATQNDIPIAYFPAKWKKEGKRAGPIRNLEMAKYADALIAVWDGESRGTENMMETMHRVKKPVFCYYVLEK